MGIPVEEDFLCIGMNVSRALIRLEYDCGGSCINSLEEGYITQSVYQWV